MTICVIECVHSLEMDAETVLNERADDVVGTAYRMQHHACHRVAAGTNRLSGGIYQRPIRAGLVRAECVLDRPA